ncbi:MAG TPA: hypothetical protein VMW25_04100 [Clostridia bacterium]|nr:hypothetical protein [Clostridia bacterium]
MQVKVGDKFYTSWGYDQTQVNFLKVIEVSPSGKTVLCKMVHSKDTGEMGVHKSLAPLDETMGQPFRLKIDIWEGHSDENGIYLRGSYPFCHDADPNSKRLATFYQCEEGKSYYETGDGYGH